MRVWDKRILRDARGAIFFSFSQTEEATLRNRRSSMSGGLRASFRKESSASTYRRYNWPPGLFEQVADAVRAAVLRRPRFEASEARWN